MGMIVNYINFTIVSLKKPLQNRIFSYVKSNALRNKGIYNEKKVRFAG